MFVQGYGVELPVHGPAHVPTGRASTGPGSAQVNLLQPHLAACCLQSNNVCSICMRRIKCTALVSGVYAVDSATRVVV